MFGEARGVTLDGIRWTVREVDASRVPGAQAPQCLLFETDGVLRRAWIYPADWSDLSDPDLATLLQSRDAACGARAQQDDVQEPGSRLLAQSAAIMARARVLAAAAIIASEENRSLRADQRALRESARRARDEMQAAVERYADSLRAAGVSRTQAAGLAVFAAHANADTVTADEVARWCQTAYEAA
jgi:hypothetical protein